VWQCIPVVRRQFPRWKDFGPLLARPPRPSSRRERKLSWDASIWDLRARAQRRAPKAVFDYVDGAAHDEVSLARSRDLFRNLEFQPRVLHDVSNVETSTSLLGAEIAFPFGFAPTGFTRMMHHEGESAVARVAQRTGIPYCLSTMGTTTPEGVAEAAPDADKWFQLYVWSDRAVSQDLADRARDSGFRTLVLTVDLPVGGDRRKDARNGLSIPPNLRIKTIVDMARHPAWWWDLFTTPPLTFASLSSTEGTVADAVDELFDASLNYADLEWLVGYWDGPVVVKGVQTVEDAVRCVDSGAAGVVLSNHGGRQLDRTTVPLRLVHPTREALSDRAAVMVDGGVTNGADIVAAVALGADACFVGRAYLYGLMAGGEDGVQRATDILTADIVRTMQLLGVTTLKELNPDMVRVP